MVEEHVQPDPVVEFAVLASGETYTAPTPVVKFIARAPVEIFAAPAPVSEYVAPAPAVTNAAPPPVFEQSIDDPLSHIRRTLDEFDIMRQSSTPVRVGDKGFDSLWGRHCEVIRIGDRHYEGEIRVLYVDEDPTVGRPECGYPVVTSGPMASAHVSTLEWVKMLSFVTSILFPVLFKCPRFSL